MKVPAEARSDTPPMAKSASVVGESLPTLGFVRCFTATTESVSIAATSMARRPWRSALASPPKCACSATAVAVTDGGVAAGTAMRAGGGTLTAGAGGGAGGRAAAGGGAGGSTGGAGVGGGAAGAAALGGSATAVGSSSEAAASASPTERTILVSPRTRMSPSCSDALLIFLPLTIVPLVEPRSMMVISVAEVTSMTACMRLTESSSSRRRWEDESLPLLIGDWVSVSVRMRSSPRKIRNVRGTLGVFPSILRLLARGAAERAAPGRLQVFRGLDDLADEVGAHLDQAAVRRPLAAGAELTLRLDQLAVDEVRV